MDDADPEVAEAAQRVLDRSNVYWEDFRDWNYADWKAKPYALWENEWDHY